MKKRNTRPVATKFVHLLLVLSSFLVVFSSNISYADYSEDFKDKTSASEETGLPYIVKPVSKITFQDFYYSDHADRPYCIENSEGRCLDKQNNFFTTLEGNARFGKRFFVYYKTEADGDTQVRLKKAYGLLKMGIWSLEVGKDTIWVGPGYHGSLLLSNNAEGFDLVRLRTDEPFRLPWIFSHIGEFKYDVFRGWAENSSLLGQRLSWRPIPILEIGANQVAYIPKGKNYDPWQYPRVLFSSNDNAGTGEKSLYDNDQKASLDIALDMPFLSKISPFVNGRIYAEYAGNDSYAWWQKEDAHAMRNEPLRKKLIWPFQFDFLWIGWMTGVYLTTGDVDFRFEYAQNYASYPLFYDLYAEYGANRRQGPWYSSLNTFHGMIMGHEMGNDSDDAYFEVTIRRKPALLKMYYDLEHHGLSQNASYPPEMRYEYGLRPEYRYENYRFFADLIYNHYKNVNFSANPLQYAIHPGTELDELIAGLGMEINF